MEGEIEKAIQVSRLNFLLVQNWTLKLMKYQHIQLQHQAQLSEVGDIEFWKESYICLADLYLANDPYSTVKPLKLLGNALSCMNKQEEKWPNFRYALESQQPLYHAVPLPSK